MNSYLKLVKSLVTKQKQVLVVIGNESVDLDSAVSSICLAYHLNNVKSDSHVIPIQKRRNQFLVVPVINSLRLELPLKTEVTYWLRKHNIELQNLLCRDEIDLKAVDSFALVDHHVSEFREKVISVLDHRPFDNKSNLNSDCFTNIQEVGSCSTLIADAIKKDVKTELVKSNYSEPLQLSYGAIVLDTINFSKEADKVRPLDIQMAEFIENLLSIEGGADHRKQLFDELANARADVSSLNSLQMLSKDLKIVSSDNGDVRVAIPAVNVFKYIEMDNAEDSVKAFAKSSNIDVVVLMGMARKENSVERFIGIINIKNEALASAVIEALKAMEQPPLRLESRPADFMGGQFFAQGNIAASRKQIFPVIKQLINS